MIGSTSINYPQALLEHLDQRGVDVRPLFEPGWIDSLRQRGAHERLDGASWSRLFRRVSAHLQDPTFPIQLAASVRPRHLGMLGFLLMSSETLAHAALVLQRYEPLNDTVNRAEWSFDATHCRLSWHALTEACDDDMTLLSLCLWIEQARALSERPDLACNLYLKRQEPVDPTLRRALEALTQGQVHFGQPLDVLEADAQVALLPVVQRAPAVHALLRQQADADLARLLGERHELIGQIRTRLAEMLPSGQPTLPALASALSMAPRTLQARLDERGLTFRQVLDQVRHEQAERLLQDPRSSLAEVALKLGFADQSSFQHAFKRWTSLTPGEFRRRQSIVA